jgi:hypothetical protein
MAINPDACGQGGGFDPNLIVHGLAESLLAAEVFFGGLD